MNKSKMILAVTGGVIGVAVLVMAYLVWSALSAKTAALEGNDESEGLESVEENARKLMRSKVFPCQKSVDLVKSNEEAVVTWKAEALKLAARGDRPVRKTTPAQFKADMIDEAKRLTGLTNSASASIMKADFAFGPFKDYIAEGKMPAEAKLAELQRQWDDVVLLVETLARSGIAELVDVQFKAAAAEAAEDAKNDRKGGKKKKSAKSAKGPETDEQGPSAQGYVLTFRTRPLGLVRSLNALATCERFAVVEGLAFSHEKDSLSEKLGGGEKKEAAQQTSGRRRRRGAQVAAEKVEEAKPKDSGIVTDPLLDDPFRVELTVTTYDFRTLEEKEEKK